MRFPRILLLGLLLVPAWTGVIAVRVPLAPNAAASKALLAQAVKAGRCFATDIFAADEGVVAKGTCDVDLPSGRYRLHAPLAMSPLGDLNVSAVEITVTAGGSSRTLAMLHFTAQDEFTDFTLDFTARGATPFTIAWKLSSDVAKKNRLKALKAPDDPEDMGKEDDPNDMPETAADGTIAVRDLAKIPYHLAASGIHIEALSPLEITAVTTDKIAYATTERGMATVTMKNVSDKPVTATLAVDILSGLENRRAVGNAALELAAGESKTWTGEFATRDLYWGAELRATVTVGMQVIADGAIFVVRDNFWETAVMNNLNYTARYNDPEAARTHIENWRNQGYTGFESGFWAPDDFGDFTPDTEVFYSGQCSYHGTITATKNLVAEAHKRGMVATVYANLWGGGGEQGYELIRKHPDWFDGGHFNSEWLEYYPLMQLGRIQPTGLWPFTMLNQGKSAEALAYHANEFIESHKQFGWDGTRYDSYYSTEWTKMATKMVRDLVAQAVPNYRWGYNSLVPTDEKANAIDVMVSGGNLIMEEGIRHAAKEPASIANYANVVFSYRDILWGHGGHFGVCYDNPDNRKEGTALDALYLCSILLAGGAHPYYSRTEDGIGHYPDFQLRYAEFIFDNRMRPLKTPEAVITFGGNPKLLEWKRLARRLDLGGDKHRLIVHLLNAPVDDLTLHNQAMVAPAPLRNQPVTVTLPAGAKITGAWNLSPIPDAAHQRLTPTQDGNAYTLTVPLVRIWNAVVIDYTAKEGIQ